MAAIGFAGCHLSRYGDVIAERTGPGRTLIGVAMVATVTSLSARLGEFDLAIDDIACTTEPRFAGISRAHAGTVVHAMVMSGAVIAALCYRPAGREFRDLGWTGLFLLAVETVHGYVPYLAGE